MDIVTARVHDADISRAIRNVVLLCDGQRVQVGTKSDYRSTDYRRPRDSGDDSSPVRSRFMKNPGGFESLGDKGCRSIFRPAKFWIGVKVTANFRELRREPHDATV